MGMDTETIVIFIGISPIIAVIGLLLIHRWQIRGANYKTETTQAHGFVVSRLDYRNSFTTVPEFLVTVMVSKGRIFEFRDPRLWALTSRGQAVRIEIRLVECRNRRTGKILHFTYEARILALLSEKIEIEAS